MKIGLSAGHSVAHEGASWYGVSEHWRVREVVDFAVETLGAAGHKVWEPRFAYYEPNKKRDLKGRIEYYNDVKLDCVVELHLDVLIEPETDGLPLDSVQGYYGIHMSNSSGGQSLVKSICGRLECIDALPGHHKPDRDHGVRYAITRNTGAWAAIIELGFLTNPETADYFKDLEHCEHVGQAVAKGIMDWGE